VGTWVPDSFSFYSGDDDKVLPGLAAVASVQVEIVFLQLYGAIACVQEGEGGNVLPGLAAVAASLDDLCRWVVFSPGSLC
jgi:hypothetical protein